MTLGYQWLADGVPVSGATARTLTPTAALVGKALSVRVTASGTGLSAVQAVSGSTADVLPSSLTSTAAPTVSGTPAVGSPLTLDAGDWDPAPDTLGVRWLVGGQVVPGATSTTFVPTTAHVGKTVVAQVTATRAGYPALTRSTVPTAAVRPAALVVPGAPTVTGTTAPGSTLRVTTPAAPAGTTSSFTWRRDGQAVPARPARRCCSGRPTSATGSRRPGRSRAPATPPPRRPRARPPSSAPRSSLVVTTTPKVKALTVSAVVTRADKVAASGTFVVAQPQPGPRARPRGLRPRDHHAARHLRAAPLPVPLPDHADRPGLGGPAQRPHRLTRPRRPGPAGRSRLAG